MPAAPRSPYGFAGYAQTARFLTTVARKPISRQWVYANWRRRDRNGFPDKYHVVGTDLRDYDLFMLEEVLTWYVGNRKNGQENVPLLPPRRHRHKLLVTGRGIPQGIFEPEGRTRR